MISAAEMAKVYRNTPTKYAQEDNPHNARFPRI
jgi:hypothetical protein